MLKRSHARAESVRRQTKAEKPLSENEKVAVERRELEENSILLQRLIDDIEDFVLRKVRKILEANRRELAKSRRSKEGSAPTLVPGPSNEDYTQMYYKIRCCLNLVGLLGPWLAKPFSAPELTVRLVEVGRPPSHPFCNSICRSSTRTRGHARAYSPLLAVLSLSISHMLLPFLCQSALRVLMAHV
jgi:hypothetical protein